MSTPVANDPRVARVLVVDEDAGCRLLVEDLLSGAGVDTIGCTHTGEAPSIACRANPDIIILDLVPDSEVVGLGVLEALANHPSTRSAHFIVSSTSSLLLQTFASTFERLKCQTILKPYDVNMLLRAVLANRCSASV